MFWAEVQACGCEGRGGGRERGREGGRERKRGKKGGREKEEREREGEGGERGRDEEGRRAGRRGVRKENVNFHDTKDDKAQCKPPAQQSSLLFQCTCKVHTTRGQSTQSKQ